MHKNTTSITITIIFKNEHVSNILLETILMILIFTEKSRKFQLITEITDI